MVALFGGFGSRLHGDAVPAGPADGSAPAAPAGSAAGPGGAAMPAAPPDAALEAAPGVEAPPEEEAVAAIRQAIRLREYSRRTEQSYVAWVQRYYAFLRHSGRTAKTPMMDETSAVAFLDDLSRRGLSARSRNQAASALNFLIREVLGRDDIAAPRAKGPVRVPMVLTHREVMRLLDELTGKYLLIGMLLYSSGLRISECMSLRVKDVDFELRQILVRDGKGRKDRHVPLAQRVVGLLRAQIRRVAELHARDRAAGHGWAPLPGALHRKSPNAGWDIGWQFIFPASTVNQDPASGHTGRWPLHVTAAERAIKRGVRASGIPKPATCHTLRHSFATETLRGGCDIRTLQQIMGHTDIRTTMIYLHVIQQTGLYVRSPLDRPDDGYDFSSDIVSPRALPGTDDLPDVETHGYGRRAGAGVEAGRAAGTGAGVSTDSPARVAAPRTRAEAEGASGPAPGPEAGGAAGTGTRAGAGGAARPAPRPGTDGHGEVAAPRPPTPRRRPPSPPRA
ncbi:MAG TPA: integron integrase [Longimicrobiales bacterium]|nr:integron integrase [Longimicrobiales bacterium]